MRVDAYTPPPVVAAFPESRQSRFVPPRPPPPEPAVLDVRVQLTSIALYSAPPPCVALLEMKVLFITTLPLVPAPFCARLPRNRQLLTVPPPTPPPLK